MNSVDMISELEDRARTAGLTVEELCELAGTARSTFTRWKAKITQPNLSTYNKFCIVLNKIEKRKAAPPKEKPKRRTEATL